MGGTGRSRAPRGECAERGQLFDLGIEEYVGANEQRGVSCWAKAANTVSKSRLVLALKTWS